MIEAAVTVSTTFDVILLCGSLFLEGHVFALEANLGDNNFWCFHWLIFALNNGILACGNIDRSDLKFILCLMCGVSQPCIDNFHTKEFYSDLCQLWFEEYYCNVFVVSITFSGVISLKVIYPKTWNPARGILFFICLLWNFEIKDYQKNLIWTRSK